MHEEVTLKILNLIAHITESETQDLLETIERCGTVDDIHDVFLDNNIRWADIVEEDIIRIIANQEPLYFASAETYVARYRRRCRIRYVELRSQGGLRDISFYGKQVKDMIAAWKIQSQILGVSLSDYYEGFACLVEAKAFYDSEEWQRKAKVTRYLWHYQCTSCQRYRVKLHAHHELPIISAYHPRFKDNFSDGKLRTLCEDCHREFHAQTVRGDGPYYIFTDAGEVKEEKEYLRLLRSAHDRVKLCPYCYDYQPDWYKLYGHWRPTAQS